MTSTEIYVVSLVAIAMLAWMNGFASAHAVMEVISRRQRRKQEQERRHAR